MNSEVIHGRLTPRQAVPTLEVPTLSGQSFRLADQHPEAFTMLVYYRGLHCPICKGYIRDLDSKLADFQALGVSVLALSSDTAARARQQQADWGIEHLDLGHSLSIDKAREWGLYVSRGFKEPEPEIFSEPGLFLIRPDGTLYAAAVQTMPFTRPNFAELLKGLEYIIKKDYPARGEA